MYNCNRLLKAADHIHVGVRTCTEASAFIVGASHTYLLEKDLKNVREGTAHGI
jgi:hypothetical protein